MKYYLFCLVLFVLTLSCENNFDEYRVVENSLSQVSVAYEIADITSKLEGDGGYNLQKGGEYAQLYAFRNFDTRQFISTDNFSGNLWKFGYDLLPTINNVIERSSPGTAESFPAFNAIGKISKVMVMGMLTDAFGDIPYFSAGMAPFDPDQIFPEYDSQEDIYNDFFKLLDEAIISLNGTSDFNLADIDRVYNGDVSKWAKLANSLRFRLAMRVRFVDVALGESEVSKALEGELIDNNEESALLLHVAGLDESPVFDNDEGASAWRMSEKIINRLQTSNDPRLPLYADLNNIGEYRGLPNGILNVSDDDAFSDLGEGISQPDTPDVLFLFSEVAFLKAEAYLFGIGVSANLDQANTEFRVGIEASMQFWGVDQVDIDTFLEGPLGILEGTEEEKFEMIMEQKWIAFINNGTEAYSEIRRTGYPVLPQRTDATNYYLGDTNGLTPTRSPYPSDESVNNAANFKLASAATDQNSILFRVWWDKD